MQTKCTKMVSAFNEILEIKHCAYLFYVTEGRAGYELGNGPDRLKHI